jgi:hypothetical protein
MWLIHGSTAVRWTQKDLIRARGIVLAAVVALVLVIYLISRLRGS